MLLKILVILHTLGSTVWMGGHLVLAVRILAQAWKNRDRDRIHQFEEHFEGLAKKLNSTPTLAITPWNPESRLASI